MKIDVKLAAPVRKIVAYRGRSSGALYFTAASGEVVCASHANIQVLKEEWSDFSASAYEPLYEGDVITITL